MLKNLALIVVFAVFAGPVDTVASETPSRTIYVKFHDDLPIRVAPGSERLVPSGSLPESLAGLNALPGGWSPVHSLSEAELRFYRERGQQRTRRPLPDLTVEFYLTPDNPGDIEHLLADLNAHPLVEHAELNLEASLPSLPPDFEPNQTYLNNQIGVGAHSIWSNPGATGTGIRVAVIKYNFNQNHADLPSNILVLGPKGNCTGPGDEHHGTATIGVIASRGNGWGTTGIAPNATILFSGAGCSPPNIPQAITRVFPYLNYGDVILIEQQVPNDQDTIHMPVEWQLGVYNAVKSAVSNGFVVVVPAANGSKTGFIGQNLDDWAPQFGGPPHGPFLRQNDSGAIYVGASFGTGSNLYARVGFSNYGERLDLQAFGNWSVWTTGYGHAYSSGGHNLLYTNQYAGTSSASAIIAGTVALLQSAIVSTHGVRASPQQIRLALTQTGVPQNHAVNPGNIGPHPWLPAALNVPMPPAWIYVQDNYCYGMGSASWASVPGATSYVLRALTEYNFSYDAYTGPNTSTNLGVSETTYYRTRACASGACSAWTYYAGPLQYHPYCL